jgi:site-specific recombinase XerD
MYKRFKKVVNYALRQGVIAANPCADVPCRTDNSILRKDILTLQEMSELINTPYECDEDVRRAFIFCLYTGLRFCDVKDLTFANIDFSAKLLKFEQRKTAGHSHSSGVIVPLNDGILALVGGNADNRQKPIFTLPKYNACLRLLAQWVKRAGICKHITWHCARHSFAVNILNNGANIKTLASLLGHSGLQQTEKYTRAVDSLKEAAINSLPMLENGRICCR